MTKKFKMVVISLTFLIIGGVCIACGKKTKESTTQETTQVTTEVTSEELKSKGEYTLEVPENYSILIKEGDTSTYTVSEHVQFVYTVEKLTMDPNEYDGTYLHMLLDTFSLDGGKETSFNTYNHNDVKVAEYMARKSSTGQYICVNVIVDPTNEYLITLALPMAFEPTSDSSEMTNALDEYWIFVSKFLEKNFGP